MAKNDQLMRDTVLVGFGNLDFGTKNTAFSIPIPEGYAMELDSVDFLTSSGANPVTNRCKMILVDDPDEIADPGHSAEKVITSTEKLIDTDAQTLRAVETMDCHKTLLVKNPNLISVLDVDPAAAFNTYARIWFDFIKISDGEIVDLLRQQQY